MKRLLRIFEDLKSKIGECKSPRNPEAGKFARMIRSSKFFELTQRTVCSSVRLQVVSSNHKAVRTDNRELRENRMPRFEQREFVLFLK